MRLMQNRYILTLCTYTRRYSVYARQRHRQLMKQHTCKQTQVKIERGHKQTYLQQTIDYLRGESRYNFKRALIPRYVGANRNTDEDVYPKVDNGEVMNRLKPFIQRHRHLRPPNSFSPFPISSSITIFEFHLFPSLFLSLSLWCVCLIFS